MGIEKEIADILNEYEANDLARTLMERTRLLPPPSREERESITRILEDVTLELPQHRAVWVAFWLGCAWQDGRASLGLT
jgi:hypothetical protein